MVKSKALGFTFHKIQRAAKEKVLLYDDHVSSFVCWKKPLHTENKGNSTDWRKMAVKGAN